MIGLLLRLAEKFRGEVRLPLLCAVLLSGCGGTDAGRVAGGGRVTLGGEKVKAASISFQPKGGLGVSALAEVKDGVYSFTRETGPAPGPQRVIVEIFGADKLESLQGKPGSGTGGGRWTLEYDVPAAGPFAKDFDLDASGRAKGQ